MTTKTKLEQTIQKLTERGYIRYPKTEKEFPTGNKVIILMQLSNDAPWTQRKVAAQDWEYYKKTTDIKNRKFYFKKIE